jgi:hypothetical protein
MTRRLRFLTIRETRPGEVHPAEVRPGEVRPDEARPAEVRPAMEIDLPDSVIGQIRQTGPAQASAASSGPVSRQASGTVW